MFIKLSDSIHPKDAVVLRQMESLSGYATDVRRTLMELWWYSVTFFLKKSSGMRDRV